MSDKPWEQFMDIHDKDTLEELPLEPVLEAFHYWREGEPIFALQIIDQAKEEAGIG